MLVDSPATRDHRSQAACRFQQALQSGRHASLSRRQARSLPAPPASNYAHFGRFFITANDCRSSPNQAHASSSRLQEFDENTGMEHRESAHNRYFHAIAASVGRHRPPGPVRPERAIIGEPYITFSCKDSTADSLAEYFRNIISRILRRVLMLQGRFHRACQFESLDSFPAADRRFASN
jgi:hypothetical protein